MDNNNLSITFSDNINSDSVRRFIEKLDRTNKSFPESATLTISISSPGGDIDIAIELYNFLKTLECHVKTINTSYVNSAAVIVFLAGDERVCLPGSSFYVHSVTKKLDGVYDAATLIREVLEMNTNTDKITGLLEQTTKKNKSYWKRMMHKGYIITSNKAIELGLIHAVEDYTNNRYRDVTDTQTANLL